MSSYQDLHIYHHGINVKHFFSSRAQQPAGITSLLERQIKPHFSPTGSGNFAADVWIQRTCGFKNVNKHWLFLNGSWEMLPGQVTAAGEGSHARFLYGRWELGNGKWAMAHRPVTMDHRKV
jgi:hypothetical protein